MIHANELQIGDWVFCTYPSINKPVRVAEIKTVGDNKLKIVINDDDIRLVFNETYITPIPLTDVILEKNFPTAEELAWWPVEDGLHCESRNTEDIMVSGVFRFVHQLQRALRLCGIKKEITI